LHQALNELSKKRLKQTNIVDVRAAKEATQESLRKTALNAITPDSGGFQQTLDG